MTELIQKILDFLKTQKEPVKMQDIADAIREDKTLMYKDGLRWLIEHEIVKKDVQNGATKYVLTPACAYLDKYYSNSLSLLKDKDNVHGLLKRNINMLVDVNARNARSARENPAEYPSDPEEIVEAARSCGYVMSVYEASKFFSTYAAVGWIDRNGTVIRNWRALLPIWKVSQSPKQRSDALKEAKRRAEGLPPIDPDTKIYEYYEDAQGRKWRKRPEDSDWEEIFEEITFSDGTKAIKGVV